MIRLLVLLLLLLPGLALAQGTASLVADSVTVTAEGRLVARGNVEVFYDGTRLSAAEIAYDQSGDRLTIAGPIFIEAPDGTILTADAAALDPALENGILRGARLVLERQLQLAAARIDRVDGRYSALTRTVATSCQVCGTGAPLWEIRADRVIHDEVEQQLYFENATFRIRGLPVLWIPRMRLPDPGLERSRGLLIPSLRSTDLLGTGLKLPYFIPLGPSRDLTLTPYLSTATRTLEARYRQAWLSGVLEVQGAVTGDDVRPDTTRGYLFADGRWALEDGQSIVFQLQAVSDDAYLRDYDYSDDDRLRTGLRYARVREDSLLFADVIHYQTLRSDEDQDALPPFVARAAYERRTDLWDGRLTYGARAESFLRTGDLIGPTGRDVARVGGFVDWGREAILPGGVVLETATSLELGYYRIEDDPAYSRAVGRTTPGMRATLRWPLARADDDGSVQVIEPLISFVWSDTYGGAVPNEDSAVVEFDEANLAALTRYPGQDARETGPRISLGLDYTRFGAEGTEIGLTFGRIYRFDADEGFTLASGLNGLSSDWLLSARLGLPGGLAFRARTVFDDSLDFDKTEARIDWANAALDLAATYVYLPAEPSEGRDEKIAEWSAEGVWQLDPYWSVSADGRYDLADDRPVEAGFGVGWRNECVEVDLSISRRYTSSDEVNPSTDFGFAVNLRGFSTGDGVVAPPGRCRE